MMKYTIRLFCLCSILAVGVSTARAVEIKAVPVEQDSSTAAATKKQSASIGPREPEAKTHGLGMDVFLEKNISIRSGILLPRAEESYSQTGQTGTSGGINLNPSKLVGIVGLKVQF